MSRLRCLLAAATLLAAQAAGAQLSIPNINAPKQAAQRAADAENARLSAQTGQAVPVRSGPPAVTTAAPPAPAPSAVAQQGHVLGAGVASVASARLGEPVTRETFSYGPEGRRDPFYSLILTDDLRPLLSDLRLVGVLYDGTGRRSVAIFRDVLTNAQYRVGTGNPLGRMRVAQIKQKGVIFTIDEFGLSRQDSLMLSDTTKVRIR